MIYTRQLVGWSPLIGTLRQAGVLGKAADPAWEMVARGLELHVSDNIPLHPELKGGYHPEYEGFPKNFKKVQVKQAENYF